MKKAAAVILAAIMALGIGATSVYAAHGGRCDFADTARCAVWKSACRFVDADGDGVCDHRADKKACGGRNTDTAACDSSCNNRTGASCGNICENDRNSVDCRNTDSVCSSTGTVSNSCRSRTDTACGNADICVSTGIEDGNCTNGTDVACDDACDSYTDPACDSADVCEDTWAGNGSHHQESYHQNSHHQDGHHQGGHGRHGR